MHIRVAFMISAVAQPVSQSQADFVAALAVGSRSRTHLLLALRQLTASALAATAAAVDDVCVVSRAADLRASARESDVLMWMDELFYDFSGPGDPWLNPPQPNWGTEDAIHAARVELSLELAVGVGWAIPEYVSRGSQMERNNNMEAPALNAATLRAGADRLKVAESRYAIFSATEFIDASLNKVPWQETAPPPPWMRAEGAVRPSCRVRLAT